MIDFNSKTPALFCNPRTPVSEQERTAELLLNASTHGELWFSTSGTTAPFGIRKWVALSRHALLISAEAVNRHLNSDSRDSWLSPLPPFHVGGIGIYARAYLSGARYWNCYSPRWDPEVYRQGLADSAATLTALVPTQLHDLVQRSSSPPPSLRAAVIGGGKLCDGLAQQARKLGWPILKSFGMTECSSQIATATFKDLSSDYLPLLHHVEARIAHSGILELKSEALLSAYATLANGNLQALWNPVVEGWFATNDRALLERDSLMPLGRDSDWVKIGGENCNVSALQEVWNGCCKEIQNSGDSILLPLPDERLGHVFALITAPDLVPSTREAIQLYNARVMPYERIRATYILPLIPRSELGKVIIGAVREAVMCK